MSSIVTWIVEILAVDEEEIHDDSYLVDLGLDSLALMELVLTLRKQFGLTAQESEARQLLLSLDRFLPDGVRTPPGQDVKLAEITEHLQVRTICDFVESRLSVGSQPT